MAAFAIFSAMKREINSAGFAPVKIILLVSSLGWMPTLLLANQPFITDDPEPTDYQHWKADFFTAGDAAGSTYNLTGPAVEVDYGVLPNTQISLNLGMAATTGGGNATAAGLGDTGVSVKYRFVQESNGWPQLAFFPGVTLPTGDANRNLGNGRATYHLPLWAQKSFGAWTVDAGGGVFLNSAPDAKNYPYGGLLFQRAWSEQLSLGGELVAQGSDANGDHGYAALNFGGSYFFNEHFCLQASAGHSVIGDEHLLWYLGVHWEW